MPRKACCCNIVPPVVGSCCRPIYNGCIGKTYEFSFQFSVKYPCTKPNGSPVIYECQNNSSLTYDIPGDFETYELTMQYTIQTPAELRAAPACVGINNSGVIANCGSWACQGSGFNPTVPSTWKYCFESIFTFSCTKCNCYTSSDYSYCNFDAGNLKTSCNCNTGFIPFIYRCTVDGSEVPMLDGSNFAPCGTDGFGNIRAFTLIQEGNSQLIDLWSACYQFYEIKQNDFGFTDFGCGCTFEPGQRNFLANLVDTYSLQFIPNPNIPEQNNPNFETRTQPFLNSFEFYCDANGGGSALLPPGYNISIEIGVEYSHNFNCGGTPSNPAIEQLRIPFQICEDTFFGGLYYDGLFIEAKFNRSSFTTDPFDLCIPPSTTSHVKNNSGGRCTSEIFYSDSYTNFYENGTIGNNGSISNDFDTLVPRPLIADICQTPPFDASVPDSFYCNFVRFTNKILVNEV
jgi:hypothetical protein